MGRTNQTVSLTEFATFQRAFAALSEKVVSQETQIKTLMDEVATLKATAGVAPGEYEQTCHDGLDSKIHAHEKMEKMKMLAQEIWTYASAKEYADAHDDIKGFTYNSNHKAPWFHTEIKVENITCASNPGGKRNWKTCKLYVK